jgi:hypothetical protein
MTEPATRNPWRPSTDMVVIVIAAIIIVVGLWMMDP